MLGKMCQYVDFDVLLKKTKVHVADYFLKTLNFELNTRMQLRHTYVAFFIFMASSGSTWPNNSDRLIDTDWSTKVSMRSYWLYVCCNGVTRVGDTRGGN